MWLETNFTTRAHFETYTYHIQQFFLRSLEFYNDDNGKTTSEQTSKTSILWNAGATDAQFDWDTSDISAFAEKYPPSFKVNFGVSVGAPTQWIEMHFDVGCCGKTLFKPAFYNIFITD